MHLVDPHWPYLPPGEWIARFGRPEDISDLLDKVVNRIPLSGEDDIEDAIRLYDAEIAYADDQLGRLFTELKTLDLYEESLIIITSDHGEAFYEHGHWLSECTTLSIRSGTMKIHHHARRGVGRNA